MRWAAVPWHGRPAAPVAVDEARHHARRQGVAKGATHRAGQARSGLPFYCCCVRLLTVAIVALTFLQPAYGQLFVESREVRVADSVRIKAIPSEPGKPWGPGSQSDPAALRSIDYKSASNKPFEWFLKFNLKPFKGLQINSARLRVTKCAASDECKTHCTAANTCSCPSVVSVTPSVRDVDDLSCGGGNILEQYDASSDDLHAWHIPSDWGSTWKYQDWAQTWNGDSHNGVENSPKIGSSSALAYARYLGGVSEVGVAGTAEIEVIQAIGAVDPGSNEQTGLQYSVADGYVSIRLTVNGSSSRFFVPEGGDFMYVPSLRLGHSYTTAPPDTTAQADAGVSTSTLTSSTRSTSDTTTTTRTTTTSTITTTTIPKSTITTITTTATTTNPGRKSTPILTSSTGFLILSTTTTGVASTTTSEVATVGVDVSHIFVVEVDQDVDLAAAISSTSFKASCDAAVASASGTSAQAVTVISVVLAPGHGHKVILQYRILVKSPAEQAELVAVLQGAEFANSFRAWLVEYARQHGMRISQSDFVRLSTSSQTFPGFGGKGTKQFTRESVGNALDLFGSPEWPNDAVASWAGNATPAIQTALEKTLSSLGVPLALQTVSVIPGPVSVSPSYVRARFLIHAQVPPIQVAIDTDGSMYRDLFQSYHSVIKNLGDSVQFQQSVLDELRAIGVPQIPGMAFTIADSSAPVEPSSAGGSFQLIALMLIFVALATCAGACNFVTKRHFLRCLRQQHGVSATATATSGQKKTPATETDFGDCQVRPFDEDCESQVCQCGEEVAPGSGKCWKCGEAKSSTVVSAPRQQSSSFCNLKFALHELGSKSLSNDFTVAGSSPSSAISVSPSCSRSRTKPVSQEKPAHSPDSIESLGDEHSLPMKLDYSDRPRAAKPSNHYNLGNELERRRPRPLGGPGRPSPASAASTEVPDGASAVDSSSGGFLSPQRMRHCDSDSRPGTRKNTARSHASLATPRDIVEVIEVTDSDSDESEEQMVTSPSRAVLMRHRGSLAWDELPKGVEGKEMASRDADTHPALQDRPSRPNTSSSRRPIASLSARLFRRTFKSYFVAQEGSLPPPGDPLPHRLSNVHGLGPEDNRSSGSDEFVVTSASASEVVEVVDL